MGETKGTKKQKILLVDMRSSNRQPLRTPRTSSAAATATGLGNVAVRASAAASALPRTRYVALIKPFGRTSYQARPSDERNIYISLGILLIIVTHFCLRSPNSEYIVSTELKFAASKRSRNQCQPESIFTEKNNVW